MDEVEFNGESPFPEAAIEQKSEPAADEAVTEKMEETRINYGIITTLLEDPQFANLTSELSSNIILLLLESQKAGISEDDFMNYFLALKKIDDTRGTQEGIYVLSHFSRWLMQKMIILTNDKGQEEQWQVISSTLNELYKKKPTLGIRNTENGSLQTVSVMTAVKGLYAHFRKQVKANLPLFNPY